MQSLQIGTHLNLTHPDLNVYSEAAKTAAKQIKFGIIRPTKSL